MWIQYHKPLGNFTCIWRYYYVSNPGKKTFDCSLFCIGLLNHMGVLDTICDLCSFPSRARIKPRFEKLARYADFPVAKPRQLRTYLCSYSAVDFFGETR